MKISLLTGGKDIHYAFGLLSGLVSKTIEIEFIGNESWKDANIFKNENVIYYDLRGDQSPNASIKEKILRVLRYYIKLFRYAAKTDSKLFHIQWLNKFTYFDRTFLNIYYKILGKKLIFTAHDINYRKLVGSDTVINRLSLKFMYRIVDHLIVHTEKMKTELIENYNVRANRISVIPFGINIVMPNTELTSMQAKFKLKLEENDKIILFFGNIAPYKGLELLILALIHLKVRLKKFKLMIAGRIKHDCKAYWDNILKLIEEHDLKDNIIERIEYIPEEEAEIYFKSADVLILPYKNIFQSGVIYTAYYFGLPVVATDIGSLKEDIVEGKTGFVCRPEDPKDLAEKIYLYYHSDLYKDLKANREKIIKYANENHSWERTGDKTYAVYQNIQLESKRTR